MTVVEQHQGGVDDLAIHVGRLALPVPEWSLGVNPLVELVFALVPQHHLLAKTEKKISAINWDNVSTNSEYLIYYLIENLYE